MSATCRPTLSENTTGQFASYVYINCLYSDKAYKKQGLTRAGNFVLIPMSAVTSVVDTVLGIGAGLASIATLGQYQSLNYQSHKFIRLSREIVKVPLICVLRTLNPEVKFTANSKIESRDLVIGYEGLGFIAHHVRNKLEPIAENFASSDNWIERHVATRLTYALMLVAAVVARVADLVIGLLAFVLTLSNKVKCVTTD